MDSLVYGVIWLLLLACIWLVGVRMWDEDLGYDEALARDDYLDEPRFDEDAGR